MSAVPAQAPVVITTCSASKRCRNAIGIGGLPLGPQDSVARAWLERIADETHLMPARSLYRGRAFGLALRAADCLGAALRIISAGLGYVCGETLIPAYDLTIRSTGPGSVSSHVGKGFDARDWWRSIANGPYASDFIADLVNRPLVLTCLSRSYATMISEDLLAIAETNSTSLRIFGLSIGASLPESLRPYALPYDERLSDLGLAGTRVDFPQRALLDYVEHVAPQKGDLEFDRSAVEARMRSGNRTHNPKRRQNRVDDATIRDLIADLIPVVGANRARLLGHIRHEKGLSCEQGRFSRLYDDVRREMIL